jgi:hypothetical protein
MFMPGGDGDQKASDRTARDFVFASFDETADSDNQTKSHILRQVSHIEPTKPRPRWRGWMIFFVSMATMAAVIACVALSYPPAAIVVAAFFLVFGLRHLLFVKVLTRKIKKRNP